MSSMMVGETNVTVARLLESLSEEGSIDAVCERLLVNQLDAIDSLQKLAMRLKLFGVLMAGDAEIEALQIQSEKNTKRVEQWKKSISGGDEHLSESLLYLISVEKFDILNGMERLL